MSNATPNKPAKNHPWRTPLKVHDWAKEQSQIRNITTVAAARPHTLARKKPTRRVSGQV